MEYDFREISDIGLEIEFSNIKRETPNFTNSLQRRLANFRHVHDASTETPEICIGNIPIQFEVNGKTNKLLSILRNKHLETIGGEMNSPIMPSNDFRQHIYRLMDFLIDMGESFSTTEQDNRGSIHVHINVSKDIKHKHLIRLLELGLATEAIFYRLGGMGRVNRGVKNSFIYQRPLTLPPCVPYDNKYYPIFEYKDLLESKNKSDFYNKYGDTISHIRNGNHYVTQRYMGLNFYSIPYRGSIEFRYANKVLIPEWIIAWIILCQSLVNFALTKSKDESFENEYRKLEDNRDIPINEIKYIFDKLGIGEDYQITLLDIWGQTDIPYFNGKQIVTHLQNPSFYTGNIPYITQPIEIAEKIAVEDIRTISSEKTNKLSRVIQDNYVQLDYIIDTSGVKSKLKDLGIRVEENLNLVENNFNINRNDYIRHWLRMGFNIENYTQDDANEFVQNRILSERFVPLSILQIDVDYEFDTKYPELKLVFNIAGNHNIREIDFSFYNADDGIESNIQRISTERIDELNTRVVNFSAFINDCHNNPQVYFTENLEENNEEDLFNVEFDDANPVIVNVDGMNNINEAVQELRMNIHRINPFHNNPQERNEE